MVKNVAGSIFVLITLAVCSNVAAQVTVRTGSITGTVTDESKAALPGVTVTVTSPMLQVPQLVELTNARGEYEIKDLPPGTYQVAFDLTGFAKLVRTDVTLTTGFVARIDMSMKIATLAETVTVSGQSPLVDLETTRGGGTVSKDLLVEIPNNRNYQDVENLTPGMVTVVPPQDGVIGMKGEANGFKNYGLTGQERATIEGVDMHSNENPDFAAVEEVDVKTFGNSAEVATPGPQVQLVVKSGGNNFHGRYNEQYMTDKLQSNNVDAALRAQGIAAGDTAVYYEDLSGDLGGRLVRDKVWFYGALRDKRSKRTLPGYSAAPGPGPASSCPGYADYSTGGCWNSPLAAQGHPAVLENDEMIKVSYQASPKNRFVGFYSRNKWDEKQYIGNAVGTARFTPVPTTPYLRYYNYQSKGEWNGTLSNRLVANVMYGDGWYVADYTNDCNVPDRPACVTPAPPATVDLATQIQTGTPFVNGLFHRPRDRYQLSGTLSYFPERFLGGTHEFKVGYQQWWERLELLIPDRGAAGNYQLQYDNGVPTQIVTANFPVDGKSSTNSNFGFVTDTWRVSKRLTANLGLRGEYANAFVPPQTKVQGVFGSSGSFSQIPGGTWTTWAPRAGFAFDLTGDNKTVLKGTYGWFNELLSDGFANAYNPNTQTSTTYLWTDPTHCNCYVPGTVNLATNNNPAFISITGGSTTFLNPGLKKPYAQEVTSSLEREFPGAMSVRALYVFQTEAQSQVVVNVARPYSAYSIPIVRQDPGPTGVYGPGSSSYGTLTLYDYTPDYLGSNFVHNEYLNADSAHIDHYNSFELTLVKRPSKSRWYATTSILVTKQHRFINKVIQSPNDNLFNLDETVAMNYRLAAAYRMPGNVNISSLYTLQNGLPGQPTYIFRKVDPNGGATIADTGNITERVGQFGSVHGPMRPNWNLQVQRGFSISKGRKLSVDFDILNVMNSNPSWATNYAEGPSYGQITSVQPPRIARFDVAFEF